MCLYHIPSDRLCRNIPCALSEIPPRRPGEPVPRTKVAVSCTTTVTLESDLSLDGSLITRSAPRGVIIFKNANLCFPQPPAALR